MNEMEVKGFTKHHQQLAKTELYTLLGFLERDQVEDLRQRLIEGRITTSYFGTFIGKRPVCGCLYGTTFILRQEGDDYTEKDGYQWLKRFPLLVMNRSDKRSPLEEIAINLSHRPAASILEGRWILKHIDQYLEMTK